MIRNSLAARKRASLRPASHIALAIALATGAFAASSAIAPAAYAQSKPKFSKKFKKAAEEVEKAFGVIAGDAALQAAAEQLKTADEAAKPALRAQLEAKTGMSGKIENMIAAIANDDDRYTGGQFTLNWGVTTRDTEVQQRGLLLSLQSGKTPAEKLGQYNWFVGTIAFQKEDYPTAQTYVRRAIDAGWNEGNPVTILAESFFRANDTGNGAQAVLDMAVANPALVTEETVTGALKYAYDAGAFVHVVKLVTLLKDRYPSEEATRYYDNVPRQTAGDMTADALASQIKQLITDDPSVANWSFAANAIVENANYTESEGVDAMRLLRRVNGLRMGYEFRDYLKGLNASLYPTEAQAVIAAASAAGFGSDQDVQEAATTARNNAGSDVEYATDAGNRRRAASSPNVAVSMANTALSLGNAALAEEMFGLVIKNRSGDTSLAQLRLGVARMDQGNFDGAREAFAGVTGKHANLAMLWSLYADSLQSAEPTAM